MGLGEPGISKKIHEIQMLEKSHLEQRVVINDKVAKLAKLDYDLKKQKFIQKSIDQSELE